MAIASFLVKFLPYLMVFQSREPSNEETKSTTPSKTSSFKTKAKLLSWLFGNPLATFDNLIPIDQSPSTSHSDIPLPTDQNILQHWMYLVDERRDSLRMPDEFYVSITYEIVDNLTAYWQLYSSEELR